MTTANSGAEPGEFVELMRAVQAGSQDAAWQLIEIYGPHLQRVIRRSLAADLRSRFDSVDFAQAVWMSFFDNRAHASTFSKPEELLRFLAVVAKNKVISEFRRQFHAAKRDIRRESPQSKTLQMTPDSLASREASPSQFAIARERWQRLVSGQPARNQSILKMRYMGETNEAIAATLKINEKTVRRVMAKFFEEDSHGS